MSLALHLARRGLGRVAPNPAVGCVIAKDGQIVGRGWTQPGGRPHAETQALAQAREVAPDALSGAAAYVTLEPCAHQGQTGPCAQALIEAGVSTVHIALPDPDSRVSGKGVDMLRAAGLEVFLWEEPEAARLNAGFLTLQRRNRPMVTLKIATDADGMMRAPEGRPARLTGALAQRRMHLMRAEHDVILIGRGTLEADNPSLTCRLPGLLSQSPVPAVACENRRIGPEFTLSGNKNLVLLNQKSPPEMLLALGRQGFTRVLLEGGPHLARSFLRSDCVDDIVHFRTPDAPGGAAGKSGQSDLQFMGIENMSAQTKHVLTHVESWATDIGLDPGQNGLEEAAAGRPDMNQPKDPKDPKDDVFFYRRAVAQWLE